MSDKIKCFPMDLTHEAVSHLASDPNEYERITAIAHAIKARLEHLSLEEIQHAIDKRLLDLANDSESRIRISMVTGHREYAFVDSAASPLID